MCDNISNQMHCIKDKVTFVIVIGGINNNVNNTRSYQITILFMDRKIKYNSRLTSEGYCVITRCYILVKYLHL